MADMKAATSPAWAERQALGARIVEIAALGDALDREKLACLRKFDELRGWADEGAVSCAHWLSLRTGLSRGAAREQVRVARALGRLDLAPDSHHSGGAGLRARPLVPPGSSLDLAPDFHHSGGAGL